MTTIPKEILPCPMCGNQPNIHGRPDLGYRIVCTHDASPLGECSVTDNTEDEAIAAWNRRSTLHHLAKPVDGERQIGWCWRLNEDEPWQFVHGTETLRLGLPRSATEKAIVIPVYQALGAGTVAQEPAFLMCEACGSLIGDSRQCDCSKMGTETQTIVGLYATPQPTAVTASETTVKALEWSDPRKPDGKEFFQDNCIATSPLGEYRIEWKSWKGEGDGYAIDSTLGWVGCEYSLDAAKNAAQADYEQRIRSALIAAPSLASEPAPLPQDVINLVIAAREAFDTGSLEDPEGSALDKALEAFSSRVPYENEPNDVSEQEEAK